MVLLRFDCCERGLEGGTKAFVSGLELEEAGFGSEEEGGLGSVISS